MYRQRGLLESVKVIHRKTIQQVKKNLGEGSSSLLSLNLWIENKGFPF